MLRNLVIRLVDWAGRRPWTVVLATLALMASALGYARHLEIHSDFLELLPRNSPGFVAYEHQLGRIGGGGTLFVVIESPDRAANERFVEDLDATLARTITKPYEACVAANGPTSRSNPACGLQLISYTEKGTQEVHAFFDKHKWLYVDVADLQKAEESLDHEIAERSGFVDSFEDTDPHHAGAHTAPGDTATKHQHGLATYRAQWDEHRKKLNEFPSGYFASADGKTQVLRIVSTSPGTGDAIGEILFRRVQDTVRDLTAADKYPGAVIGYGGDIPNAEDEKSAIVDDAVWATLIPVGLILIGIVVFFRSVSAIFILAIPALFGVACAYAFAMAVYGYVNTAGAFLGAIILGNGINYPIVLLARYKDFRSRGQAAAEARREAVLNAFRAELVGACVASIAYGSLSITSFRGFSQFGVIGFVGMLVVWASIVPIVPALVVLDERFREKFAVRWSRWRGVPSQPPAEVTAEPYQENFFIVRATVAALRHPWICIGVGAVITLGVAWKLPSYLKDPWEYDFGRIGSKSTHQSGAQLWSQKADNAFGAKVNLAGARMLADSTEQIPALKAQLLKNADADAREAEVTGQSPKMLIGEVVTVNDFLPGNPEEQLEKIALWSRIRERLTPAVLESLDPEEQVAAREMHPPEELHPIRAEDLPDFIRRRFEENNGTVGTVFYVKPAPLVQLMDGRTQLRIAKITDNIVLPDGTLVRTASRSTVFAEMIRSMNRDGPLASIVSFGAVIVVVLLASRSLKGSVSVLAALLMGVVWMLGGAALLGQRLNFLSFIALPITFGIGSEYPFNIFDRSRILNGDVVGALRRSAGAVALCSYTTTVGYGALLVSDQQALQSFGGLAAFGEGACIIAALFVLPSILLLMNRSKRPSALPG